MHIDNKDFKSLGELNLKGDSFQIEYEYRRECSSFKDETHFYCHQDNVRLLCSDIESKKAESNAFLKSLSSLNKQHIIDFNLKGLMDGIMAIGRINTDRNKLESILTPDLIMQFRNGYSLQRLETLLFGQTSLSSDFCDKFTLYINSINNAKLDELVKLPLLIAFLWENGIRLETMVVFTSIYLNRNYSLLSNESLLSIFEGSHFKTTMRSYSKKNNGGDMMMVVREFLKLLNSSYHSFVLNLRRKVVKLRSVTAFTNNKEFNNAYASLLIFMEKTPSARDILEITTIPRRTVYRLLSAANTLND